MDSVAQDQPVHPRSPILDQHCPLIDSETIKFKVKWAEKLSYQTLCVCMYVYVFDTLQQCPSREEVHSYISMRLKYVPSNTCGQHKSRSACTSVLSDLLLHYTISSKKGIINLSADCTCSSQTRLSGCAG